MILFSVKMAHLCTNLHILNSNIRMNITCCFRKAKQPLMARLASLKARSAGVRLESSGAERAAVRNSANWSFSPPTGRLGRGAAADGEGSLGDAEEHRRLRLRQLPHAERGECCPLVARQHQPGSTRRCLPRPCSCPDYNWFSLLSSP